MKLGFNFESIQDLLRIIKFLENENIRASIDYNIPDVNFLDTFLDEMIAIDDINNLEIILNDMASKEDNFDRLFKYILDNCNSLNVLFKGYMPNINLIIDKALNAGYVPRLNMGAEFRLLILYKTTQNKRLLKFIIDNLNIFKPSELISNTFIGTLVQNVDRDTYAGLNNINDDGLKAKYLKRYDNAVKKRLTDISLGLGYAQMDNQVQSTIPSLLLQQIVNESVDTSGIPAQDVYKIVKHVNEGITNNTIRLGQPSNFEDAYPQDDLDESHDEDVIEI
jgi:hypothetical protein